MQQNYSYLLQIQYLGYRYHGWLKQPQVKTVQGTVEKVLRYVLGHEKFKTLGVSRTDAKVSANHFIVQLFVREPLSEESFLKNLNQNFPADIKALKIESVERSFNIIQSVNVKEYQYLFSFGEKVTPLCASIMANFPEDLDIDLMQKAAKLFEGHHDFKNYCKDLSDKINTKRTILLSEIEENLTYSANFFPSKSYLYHIHAPGFMRNQIRMMVGQLVLLGKGEVTLYDIQRSLESDYNCTTFTAPAAGLYLNKVVVN